MLLQKILSAMDHPSVGIKEVLLKKLKYVHTEGFD